ncbi:MAG: DUF3467 domain-containing protein [Planctomycetes bacterium]|nr:DUF3467 domain-containing protein [Planctomycetota bacterium]
MTNHGEPAGPGDPSDPQKYEMAPVSARIPTQASHWILATEVIVFQAPTEFVIDFLTRLGKPHIVAARVIISPPVFGQVIGALRENLGMYTSRFGPPAPLPVVSQPPPGAAGIVGSQPHGKPHATENRVTIDDVYADLKLPDEMLSGVYANAVMIGHTATEFWFDFITNFFPRSAVSCRICMSAQHVPGLLHSLTGAFEAAQRRAQEPPPEPPKDSAE